MGFDRHSSGCLDSPEILVEDWSLRSSDFGFESSGFFCNISTRGFFSRLWFKGETSLDSQHLNQRVSLRETHKHDITNTVVEESHQVQYSTTVPRGYFDFDRPLLLAITLCFVPFCLLSTLSYTFILELHMQTFGITISTPFSGIYGLLSNGSLGVHSTGEHKVET